VLLSAKKSPRIAVFISGSGSTLQALLEMSEFAKCCLVVSNRKNALGLLKAKRFGVHVLYMHKDLSFEQLHTRLLERNINQIFLAGFMKMLPASFLEKWQGRIFNIHPSLLPNYKGLQAFERAVADKAECGVTIHHVIAEVDAGKKVLQQKSSITSEDLNFSDSYLLLRKTEQHLLREFVLQKCATVNLLSERY